MPANPLSNPPPPLQIGKSGNRALRTPAGPVPFGQKTLQFFEEGERHERANWQDTVLPPDEETEEYVVGGPFDKIPRQKSALVILALLSVCLITGIVLGVRALAMTGRKVGTSSIALSRSPAPVPSAPPAASEPNGTPASPVLPPASPATATEVVTGGRLENASDDNAIGEAGDRAPSNARDKQVKKTLAQASHKRHKAPRKNQSASAEDGLDHEANPATSGAVVDPQPLKNPASIEPPRLLSPPPEHPAPIAPSEADPFEK